MEVSVQDWKLHRKRVEIVRSLLLDSSCPRWLWARGHGAAGGRFDRKNWYSCPPARGKSDGLMSSHKLWIYMFLPNDASLNRIQVLLPSTVSQVPLVYLLHLFRGPLSPEREMCLRSGTGRYWSAQTWTNTSKTIKNTFQQYCGQCVSVGLKVKS